MKQQFSNWAKYNGQPNMALEPSAHRMLGAPRLSAGRWPTRAMTDEGAAASWLAGVEWRMTR
jgi:hypothetical protein